MEQNEWQALSSAEKRKQLYLQQKETLDLFLERGAITPEQYRKSFHDLTEKMGMGEISEDDGLQKNR